MFWNLYFSKVMTSRVDTLLQSVDQGLCWLHCAGLGPLWRCASCNSRCAVLACAMLCPKHQLEPLSWRCALCPVLQCVQPVARCGFALHRTQSISSELINHRMQGGGKRNEEERKEQQNKVNPNGLTLWWTPAVPSGFVTRDGKRHRHHTVGVVE
eukprot:TRINITY_DN86130_c0_g1_i1.p1 TRINITY_DN86130_c0_g1~~TRINITY_DN86130_c0_g1_i1.p1  ORF type:complete len:155 (-),score=14.38 TRINITY_DN86130_c0_g1_i1:151-615(-)